MSLRVIALLGPEDSPAGIVLDAMMTDHPFTLSAVVDPNEGTDYRLEYGVPVYNDLARAIEAEGTNVLVYAQWFLSPYREVAAA